MAIHRPKWVGVLVLFSVCLGGPAASWAEDDALRLRDLQPGGAVFAGREAAQVIGLQSSLATTGTLRWALQVGGAVVARGEQGVGVTAGEMRPVTVPLAYPPVKPGVVAEGVWEVSWQGADAGAAPVALRKRLWLFPEDAWSTRTNWLQRLRIALFDPVGSTAERLEREGIPFERLKTVAGLSGTNRVLIVGEGVDLGAQRALPDLLLQAAGQGHAVLCLAPTGGSTVFPQAGGGLGGIVLRGPGMIRELDKRLAAEDGVPAGIAGPAGFLWQARREQVIGNWTAGGWPWTEFRADQAGRLVYCGFGLLEGWDQGPVPRHLLAVILEYMTQTTRETGGEE